jgi:cytochrome c-type biogenesis protein CcmE
MAQAAWEKHPSTPAIAVPRQRGRLKFLLGGLLILGAVLYLVISGTVSGARFFITVDELVEDTSYAGQPLRISGAVLGDSIQYDSENLIIEFTIANIPPQFDDLAETLHLAVNDPTATRLNVRVENQVKPDLLQHEAQAILTGTLGPDGVFHATELNLKCPSRFVEHDAGQVIAQPEV